MIPQLIGSRKSRSTQNLERLLKERGIKYHIVYLEERSLSEGEWNNIFQFYKPSELIDRESRSFRKNNLAFLDYEPKEKLAEDNLLLKLPLLRLSKKVYLDPSRDQVISLLKNLNFS